MVASPLMMSYAETVRLPQVPEAKALSRHRVRHQAAKGL
jgi:hypothetical protein